MIAVEDVLKRLLWLELTSHAIKLQFVSGSQAPLIDDKLLREALSLLNELSVAPNELEKRQLIAIAALLWNYRKPEWTGLQNCLVLFLSRAGFGPSSIMLDPDYGKEDGTYSYQESFQNRLAIALSHVTHEVRVGGKTFLLTDFQHQVWQAIDTGRLTGISAPTSAGKSYLILLKSIQLLLERPGPIVYIVPTLSLVNQVMSDYRKALDEFGLEDYVLSAGFSQGAFSARAVYILTQERAIAAFSQEETPFDRIRLLVVDEIQNVERVKTAEEQRAKVLYDLLQEFRNHASIDHIIISGPRIIKIDELGSAVFGMEAHKSETEASPVLNLTYSISQRKKKYYLSLITDLLPAPLEIWIRNEELIQGYGKVQYSERFLDYLDDIVKSFGNERVLVFAPTAPTSRNIAVHLAGNASFELESDYLLELSDFIADTVHPMFSLVETMKSGVAYHHGKLPFHVRLLLEDAIKKGLIRTVVSTTTLLQGVNLPVQNIIIRNPHLFVRQSDKTTSLTNYELANLRGRAGRLLKDFIGRTFILDESKFKEKESHQLDLFKDSVKELKVGYGATYDEYKGKIKKDIREQIGSTESNKEYAYLTTYLRQAALRYGVDTQTYLRRVGIQLSDRELNEILDSIRSLRIDRKICARNRYWDPVDLDALRDQSRMLVLPTSPSEQGISGKLQDILVFLSNQFPVYYNRYFGIDFSRNLGLLTSFCIRAERWLKEHTLAEILSDPFYDDSEKIDNAVSSLERTISFGMALLLKPLYDIQRPSSMFPRFIEMGAYRSLTRRFIELNIPRETAIYLVNNDSRFAFPDPDDRPRLLSRLKSIRNELPVWYQIQLGSL
jgi:hypothetical protein